MIAQVAELLRSHLAQFELAPEFTEDEVLHYLLPVEGVIDAYVVEGPGTLASEEGQVFISHLIVSAHPPGQHSSHAVFLMKFLQGVLTGVHWRCMSA